jgi:hypothetical protein
MGRLVRQPVAYYGSSDNNGALGLKMLQRAEWCEVVRVFGMVSMREAYSCPRMEWLDLEEVRGFVQDNPDVPFVWNGRLDVLRILVARELTSKMTIFLHDDTKIIPSDHPFLESLNTSFTAVYYSNFRSMDYYERSESASLGVYAAPLAFLDAKVRTLFYHRSVFKSSRGRHIYQSNRNRGASTLHCFSRKRRDDRDPAWLTARAEAIMGKQEPVEVSVLP